jgi:hypothetical protein
MMNIVHWLSHDNATKIEVSDSTDHVRWGSLSHSMARPRFADGGTTSSYGD